jgi:tetratricopeptide (TPR) repeat protein
LSFFNERRSDLHKKLGCLIAVGLLLLTGCAGPRKLGFRPDAVKKPDPRAVDLFIDGVLYDNDRNFGAALLSYNESLLYDWKSPSIYKNIAKDYIFLGKDQSAFLILKHALNLDSKDVETRGMIARLLAQQGNFRAAENEYRTILSIDSTSMEAYYQLALLHLRKNEPSKAIAMYRQILRHSREFDPQIYLGLSELYMDQKQYPEAESVYRKLVDIDSTEALGYFGLGMVKSAMKDSARAEFYYLQALELKPGMTDARERLGELYIEGRHWEKALALFREGIKTDSANVSNWLSIGDLYRQRGDSSRAFESFKAVQERFPKQWQPSLSLGRMLMDSGKSRDAFEQFKRVVELSPRNFWGLLLGGISLVHQDSLSSSLSWLENALELNPEDALGNYYYGTVLSQLNRAEEAIPHLRSALKTRSNWVSAITALAGAYESVKDYKLADSLYTTAIRLDSANALVLNNYGYSLSVRGVRLEEAAGMARKAVGRDPENGAYQDTMGWILFRMGDYENARPYLEKAFKLRGNSADVVEHLGDLYDKLQMKQEAKRMWEKALELSRDNAGILRKLGRTQESR